MKIYLAARYERRDELRPIAHQLSTAGHEVTSGWLWENAEHADPGDAWRIAAEVDILDIDRADTIVLFTEEPDVWFPRGSRHFELGYGFGTGLICITVGPRENVFHYLDIIPNYPTWDECFANCFDVDTELNMDDVKWGAESTQRNRELASR